MRSTRTLTCELKWVWSSGCGHVLCVCRPLRDDEVLPVRQHRVVPAAAEEGEEGEEKEVGHMTVM